MAQTQMVMMPRAGDAIGSVLRRVYGRDRSLPADMVDLLAAIDAAELAHG